MGDDDGGRDERLAPEPFEVFYLREYPLVVGLLQGLLRSRLVAEELAQETFLVAYRDWGRVSGLDNPRAWVRRVAVNQRGSFLRAYLRQQARERDSVVQYEDDSISQIAAALGRAPGTIKAQLHHGRRLREIVGHNGQAHDLAAVPPDQPLEPMDRAIPSFPPAAARLPCKPQRLAIAVNLLLVLALGVVLTRAAWQGQEAATLIPPVTTVGTQSQTLATPSTAAPRTRTSVPEACLRSAEAADEVIARLNRNLRDNRLASALKDYTVASQACRREASP